MLVVALADRESLVERIPPADADVRDLEVLIRANHSLLVLETEEPERGPVLVRWVADRLSLPMYTWSAEAGLVREELPAFPASGTGDAAKCLAYIREAKTDAIYCLAGFFPKLEDDAVAHDLAQTARWLGDRQSAMVIPTQPVDLPRPIERVATTVRLAPASPAQHYELVRMLLKDLRRRMPVRVKLTGEEVARLLQHLRGLTLFEVKKILTKAIVEDGSFTAEDIPKIAEAKREIIERSGVLEYFGADEGMGDIAGLVRLKEWLAQRKLAFTEPTRAKNFGLTPPRGLLLIGVQGCGKSLCAKAIAKEWGLPLIRLDPSRLYNKYFGESEKNLRRATEVAEQMAPIVLWIDEIEKALAQGEGEDSGTTARVFGTFLSWLQEKKAGVFVVATANDIERLPPELVRKGRFDEIFFVDLPDADVRKAILALHLSRRGRDPAQFDLDLLAARTEAFSGAEIEQAVISGLYAAFAQGRDLDTALVADEVARTVPLSSTAREKVATLREWARDRAVPAG